jgi:hypothetical protein
VLRLIAFTPDMPVGEDKKIWFSNPRCTICS